jgi:hypothetical protein
VCRDAVAGSSGRNDSGVPRRFSSSASRAFTSPTKAMSAPCSTAMHSKNVGTTRRVITSTCAGETGNESKIAKQSPFAQTHSASGMSINGEGAADFMTGSVRPGGATVSRGRIAVKWFIPTP